MDKRQAPEVAKRYADFLRKRDPRIKKIYLFGSYAKGTISDNSDIDIAVVFDTLLDTFDIQVELMKLRRKFDTRIEPHPFRESDFNMSNPLANEILSNGFELN
ncbi:Nucleotidyltransferase [uncultured Desulfobacterium sp.]|uniref:Nucleotidyltransferase n=1 Tax=uncultured Desulfobacterium sp. TaxID=201089 RepID=A0A445MYW1_9BACT|nr:Nucleotidyltransferase [uncultured Desulfobacterium sp.]